MSTLRLPPLPTIKDVVRLYNLSAMKQLSQNFILNENLSDKIIKKAGNLSGAQVLEVGPGPGGLTRSIMRKFPKRVVLVEKDTRFKPTLEMLAEAFTAVNGKMDIVLDDIRKVNLETMFPLEEKRNWDDKNPHIHVIGNLPFNVSTHLIIQWLHAISERAGPWKFGRTKMLLTFQKEVAERLVAQPCEEQRCRLSVMAQAWTFPLLRFIIPGTAFLPKPDVDVGVVTFVPLVNPRTKHEFTFFEKVTRHVFAFRQKYVIKCVGTLFPEDCRNELSDIVFKLADIDPQTRPTQLTVEDIDKIASAYKFLLEKHPEIASYNYRASRRVLSNHYTVGVEVKEYDEQLDNNSNGK